MQEAIRKMLECGRMPDEIADHPSDETVDLWQTLTESIRHPLTKEEAEVAVTLFPESDLCGLAWNLLQAMESVLSANIVSPAEYREIIQKCSSDEWRETLTMRLDNWEKQNA